VAYQVFLQNQFKALKEKELEALSKESVKEQQGWSQKL